MKKLFLLLLIAALSVGLLNAQSNVERVGISSGWNQFPVIATDIIDADGENIEKIFDLGSKTKIQYYTIFLDIDTVLIPSTVASHYIPVTLQESYDGVNYTVLSTVNYYCSADTTFTIADLSTGSLAPYLKVKLDGTDGDSVNVQLMKVVGKFVNK